VRSSNSCDGSAGASFASLSRAACLAPLASIEVDAPRLPQPFLKQCNRFLYACFCDESSLSLDGGQSGGAPSPHGGGGGIGQCCFLLCCGGAAKSNAETTSSLSFASHALLAVLRLALSASCLLLAIVSPPSAHLSSSHDAARACARRVHDDAHEAIRTHMRCPVRARMHAMGLAACRLFAFAVWPPSSRTLL
jgi:hypothetical protein